MFWSLALVGSVCCICALYRSVLAECISLSSELFVHSLVLPRCSHFADCLYNHVFKVFALIELYQAIRMIELGFLFSAFKLNRL